MAGLIGAVLMVGMIGPSPAAATTRSTMTIGNLEVTACDAVLGDTYRSWCGVLPRPLDAAGARTVPIAFALVLPRDASPDELADVLRRPVIAAFEGGPGYGGIDSGEAYAQMLGPLMDDRALLVMDARGTGRSGVISCPALQQGLMDYLRAARSCARQLGAHVDDYGTASAADDAATIISALGFSKADLYGDSYGTFMAQVLAGRHPDLVRSIVLDGAYPVTGEDAWYPTQGPALSRALDEVCAANPGCQTPTGGTKERLAELLARLRSHAIVVTAPGDDDRRHRVRITPAAVLDVAYNGTYVDTTYRELDPAIRAALSGDPMPLGRLVAEVQFPGGTSETPAENSAGQYLAVTCQDYPQLFDMTQPQATRQAQLDAAIGLTRQQNPGLFAPFTVDEYVDSSWETLDACLTWGRLPAGSFGPPAPPSGRYPDVPVLVLSGTLDTITTAAEGAMVAAQFPRAKAFDVPFGVHVQAMGNAVPCASAVVRDFFADPEAGLVSDPTGCAAPTPRMPSSFPRRSGDVGVARAAALTVTDVINRFRKSAQSTGLGLRGGSWEALDSDEHGVLIRLSGVRFTGDLPVSGSATWQPEREAFTSRIRVPGGSLTVTSAGSNAAIVVRGTIQGRRISETFTTP